MTTRLLWISENRDLQVSRYIMWFQFTYFSEQLCRYNIKFIITHSADVNAIVYALSHFPLTATYHLYMASPVLEGLLGHYISNYQELPLTLHPLVRPIISSWLVRGSYGTCLCCMLPGVQVTTELGFFLHSNRLCDSVDCDSLLSQASILSRSLVGQCTRN